MSDPLYRKELLRLAADAHGAGHLDCPQAEGTVRNPACGDQVTVELELRNGVVAAMAHTTRACVLTQASASLLAAHAAGLTRAQLVALRSEVTGMLDGQPPPQAPFDGFGAFDAARAYKPRHRCVLLPIEAALLAFDAASEPTEPASIGPET
jgi:NifU-like protein involved in Fe-S cluster formation